jgi:hypothetical protein
MMVDDPSDRLQRRAEDYDSKDEFLDGEFVSPGDYPDGVELPPEWLDGEHPHIEEATQVGDDWGEYLYKNYKIIVRRESQAQFEVRVFIPEYDDVEWVRTNHSIEGPAFIRKVTDGVVWITVKNFMQHSAFEAGEGLVDQYIEYKQGEKDVSNALSSFDE